MDREMKVGDKINFIEDKRPYTIKAYDGRYAICTKPFNLQHTVLYTICDFKEGIRGTNNLVFNMYDYAVQADIDECLKDLQIGDTEITRRNRVQINTR